MRKLYFFPQGKHLTALSQLSLEEACFPQKSEHHQFVVSESQSRQSPVIPTVWTGPCSKILPGAIACSHQLTTDEIT